MKTPNKQTLKQRCNILEQALFLVNERLKIVESIVLTEKDVTKEED